MTLARHSLQPFEPSQTDVVCSFSIQRTDGDIHLDFKLAGELTKLVIQNEIQKPLRKDELWQTTCFECFFKAKGKKSYWEFNISPTRDWNLYRFSDYRQDMKPEERVTSVQGSRSQKENEISLQCVLPVKDLVCQDEHLQVCLCCVLEYKDGAKSYHALCHPGKQPDFHHPESFFITLPPGSQSQMRLCQPLSFPHSRESSDSRKDGPRPARG